ncbi:hypothetical protein [Anaerovibrio sp. RM50]|uniref:hypothetical protein n=1 Tax=Anaerovibrio sp. RM50 TaxID=1200557 RepID=UPI000483DB8D|nr:hypothetical protein [Anaerovibrio sp. RM50]
MAFNENLYKEIMEELEASQEFITEAAGAFRWDLEQGLKKSEYSSLAMLPSFIGLPEGKEKGEFLALDFGGSNVRASVVRLLGNSNFEVLNWVEKPLVTAEYNLLNSSATSEALFDFLAETVGEAAEGNKDREYYLGHTFSFGTEQEDINTARLIKWAKEIAVPGVEGEDVNALLREALVRKGYANIKPVAILNDTVALLLAAAYTYPDTRIGCIYATGYNTCYMEVMPDVGRPACIINTESGGFSKLMPSKWDLELDRASEQPGRQRLEKMVSGKYIGELFSRLIKEVFGLTEKPSFSAVDMSAIMEDSVRAGEIFGTVLGDGASDSEVIEKLRQLAKAIAIRSARIVAASWAGTLWHLAGSSKVEPQHIAVDGSLYQHMPYIQENVRRALYEIMDEEAGGLEPVLVKDGSSIGAAIAAAVATCR